MATRLRPRVLGAVFGAYFVVVFLSAWMIAEGLSIGWYDADSSYKVYAAYLITSAILVIGLGAIAVVRSQFLDRRIIELNEQLDAAGVVDTELAAPEGGLPPPLPEAPTGKDQADKDIDDLLESLSEMETTTVREAEEMEAGLGEEASAEETVPSTKAVEWDLTKRLERARRMRRAVPAYIAGPAAIAIVVAGVSGIMLPAVGGFLQSNAKLNTALILSFSYWWPGIGAYVVAALLALLKQR